MIRKRNYTCYACAILPDHVHLSIRKHRDQAETMIEELQNGSRAAVRRMRPEWPEHRVWGGLGWKVFLDSREDIERTVAYVARNLQEARIIQPWSFVEPYDGWLPGQACKR